MNFQEFKQKMQFFPVFSVSEIGKNFSDFDRRRLIEWQQKDYIQKLRNRYYRFRDQKLEEPFLYYVSNIIYNPSYISLETALDHYGFIPETSFQIISCTTLKTTTFATDIGSFSYHHLKPQMFFGYQLISWNDHHYQIAEPEKTLIDYLYLHSEIKQANDIKALRWNIEAINDQISSKTLNEYELFINSLSLSKRISVLKEFLNVTT